MCQQLRLPVGYYRWQRTNSDWNKTHAPFFPKARASPNTYAGVGGFEKHQSICLAILFFKLRDERVRTGKSDPAPSRKSVLGDRKSLSEQKVLWYFSRIMEATSSTACDQGLIKRVHVCWGPALSFFYCADSVIWIYRNSLEGLCHILHNRSI